MNAMVWRLHRNQVYLAVGALAVLTVLLLVTGTKMANDYHAFYASCAATQSCADGPGVLFRGDGAIIDLVDLTLVVPAAVRSLLGRTVGGQGIRRRDPEPGLDPGRHPPALAEHEHAVGVRRRRRVGRRDGHAGELVAIPRERGGAPVRLATFTFDIQGIAPVAYAVFAVALGIAVGSLFRRVLPAIATTFTVFTGLRFLIAEYARPALPDPGYPRSYPPFSARTPARRAPWSCRTRPSGPDGQNYPPACRSSTSPRPAAGTGSKPPGG